MGDSSEFKKERFHFLDGLRAIACMLVVIHHSFSSNVMKLLHARNLVWLGDAVYYFTQSGVALFFVLSGVVLLRPYVRNERKFNLLSYIKRRFLRIYPTYFVALLLGYFIIVVIKYGPPSYYSEIWRWCDTRFPALIAQANLVKFKGSASYNLAWWSLQIEVVFYILAPGLVFLFSKPKKENILVILVILTAIQIAAYVLQQYLEVHFPAFYSNTNVQLNASRFIDYPICFLLGVYLAKYEFDLRISAIFAVAGVFLVFESGSYVPLINAGYGFIYAGLIILAFKVQSVQNFLDHPFMIWLGERSYSLFLVHFSVFYLVDYVCSLFLSERNWMYAVFSRGIGLPLALLTAMALFYYIERRQAKGLVTANIFWPWQLHMVKEDHI